VFLYCKLSLEISPLKPASDFLPNNLAKPDPRSLDVILQQQQQRQQQHQQRQQQINHSFLALVDMTNATMKFSGYLLDKHFGPTEAESPIDVYHQWKCDGDPPMDELRCWALLVVPNVTTVWLEVVLGLPDFFEHLRSRFEDHVTIEFRYKGSPSPNTSPHVFPSK